MPPPCLRWTSCARRADLAFLPKVRLLWSVLFSSEELKFSGRLLRSLSVPFHLASAAEENGNGKVLKRGFAAHPRIFVTLGGRLKTSEYLSARAPLRRIGKIKKALGFPKALPMEQYSSARRRPHRPVVTTLLPSRAPVSAGRVSPKTGLRSRYPFLVFSISPSF